MNATLRALAELYRHSAAGRRDAGRPYLIDYEDFLEKTDRRDGDARELAEHELAEAERASGGRFVIDRQARSGMKQRLRLKHPGGEAWLFSVTSFSSPEHQRQQLAAFFTDAAISEVPAAYAEPWRAFCEKLAARARDGGSIEPFKRENSEANESLLKALTGVLNWQGESLIRYASMVLFGNSKKLEALRPRVVAALKEITGREENILEDFGITDAPRSVWIHGPLVLDLPYGRIDLNALSGPVAISATDLDAAAAVGTSAPFCLTVENHTVFRELVKTRTGVLLVQTSFPGAATRLLFERLPSALPCHHFGDSDPAGYDILRDLREKTGREFTPLLMPFRSAPDTPPLTAGEQRDIERLLAAPVIADVHPDLQAMLDAGTKGAFEQESCGITDVLDCIQVLKEKQVTAKTRSRDDR